MRFLTVGLLVIALASGGCATVPRARQADLSLWMETVRARAAAAHREKPVFDSAEQRTPWLAEAVAQAAATPSSENLRLAGDAYARAGIFDQGFEYYSRATKLDPQNAAAWSGMARIWRDWGFAHVALGDAHRAVSYAPASAEARNTLGTVFQALGRGDLARQQFQAALRVDPRAAYALNNLCYSWRLDGNLPAASTACEEALRLAPTLSQARMNLEMVDRARAAASAVPEAPDARR